MTHKIDPGTMAAARVFISRVSQKYSVSDAILFDSHDNELSVAVLLHGQAGNSVDTTLDMADIAYGVLLDTGIHVHPLPIWESCVGKELSDIERVGVRLEWRA